MRKALTAAVAAVTLIGGIAASTEASAQYRRHRHNDNDAAAAAIAGFALGAALGGNGRVYVGGPGYYDRGYYNRGYYNRGYYRGYDRGYYRPYYHHRRCWTERYWDPYYGRVSHRVCR